MEITQIETWANSEDPIVIRPRMDTAPSAPSCTHPRMMRSLNGTRWSAQARIGSGCSRSRSTTASWGATGYGRPSSNRPQQDSESRAGCSRRGLIDALKVYLPRLFTRDWHLAPEPTRVASGALVSLLSGRQPTRIDPQMLPCPAAWLWHRAS
jgi:hypothetical protein